MNGKKPLVRLRIIAVLIILAGLGFAAKLYIIQVMRHDDFKALADRQYVKSDGGIFSRGTIYFKSKDGDLISAATLESGYLLAINPREIKDKEAAYEALSGIVTIDHALFIVKASKDDPYEEIAKKISEEQMRVIKNKNIAGVSLYPMKWRYYPGSFVAAHELGFLGYAKDDSYSGRYGLEKYYDGLLLRTKENAYANFFVQIFSDIKTGVSGGALQGDIVATIEPTVEASLEDTLKRIMSKWSAKEAGGIIMDPKTGEIYAMASEPGFNPNDLSNISDPTVFGNPLVESVREMGSIVKTLTMAAGIDAGVVSSTTTYEDKGYILADGAKIWNHDRTINGHTTMQDVLDKSLNIGAAHVERQLGNKLFAKYMNAFGLEEKTGIDLPNEAQNITTNLKSPRDVEYITASFGQGLAFTPISMIRALSALANGGTLPTPHIVTRINYGGGLGKSISPPEGARVISKETSDKITDMLIAVVDKALLGGKIKNQYYTIAAKTGTAQIAKLEGGGYYDDRFFHSFMGYFPAKNPKFIILLYVLEPQTNQFAADTLAVPFADLAKLLINYYQIPPDR